MTPEDRYAKVVQTIAEVIVKMLVLQHADLTLGLASLDRARILARTSCRGVRQKPVAGQCR